MTGLGFRRDWYPLIAGVGVVVMVEFVLILWTTHGQFTYTLDDPYIHLALAENLARFGHYGINLEEYSSPSSSIIWPLLLLPFIVIGSGIYGPLVLNVLFAIAAVLVIHHVVVSAAESHGTRAGNITWAWALFIFFSVNGFGVIFTGMEHSLHILVTASIMYLVNRMQLTADSGHAARPGYHDRLLVLCIVFSPLIRFEGLAISAFAVAMLMVLGKLRLAMLSIVLIAVSLALYFYAMSALGLPWLPSSVLVKSKIAADVAAQGDVVGKIVGALMNAASNAIENFNRAEGQLLLVIAALFTAQAIRMWYAGERISPVYVIGVLVVLALHFAFGRFGWYGRYQSYVCVFAICAALYVFAGALFRPQVSPRPKLLVVLGVLSALTVATLGIQQTLVPIFTTPIAAQNIHEQQRQMHEFATRHWKAPVAVNDIGYVAFQNDQYVLDLWGLGSEEARQLIRADDPERLRKLTVKHNVHLAMIYDELFSQVIPADWQKIAELHLSSSRVTPAYDRVAFYVIGVDRALCLQTSAQLMEFSRTLVRPQILTAYPGACDALHVSRDGNVPRANDS